MACLRSPNCLILRFYIETKDNGRLSEYLKFGYTSALRSPNIRQPRTLSPLQTRDSAATRTATTKLISRAQCCSSGTTPFFLSASRPFRSFAYSSLPSFFKTLVDHEVTVELKNDISIKGVLKSVDQFLNIKLDDIQVVEELKYPHLVRLAPFPSPVYEQGRNVRLLTAEC